VRMGAAPESVEVQIEIDAQRNVLRASATGTTELRTKDLGKQALSEREIDLRARQSVRGEIERVERVAVIGSHSVFHVLTKHRHFAGLVTRRMNQFRVVDREGIVRLQIRNGDALVANKGALLSQLRAFFEKHTIYGDAGRELPDLFVLFRGRIVDMSGLINVDQINGLLQVELNQVGDEEPTVALMKVT
jgi:N-methylhydantoinase A